MLKNCLLLPLVVLLAVPACSSDTSVPESREIKSLNVTYESRSVAVAATIVAPVVSDGEAVPLVVMAHGHGGSRQEGGGFSRVAEELAQRGIASIRMDFPGCGDSTESFTENNLGNMLLDLQAARVFAASQINVDSERVGLLGYSMGGRLVALLSEIDPGYKAMVAWAPAVADGIERTLLEFGGPNQYYAMKQTAVDEGLVVYTTRWGTQLELGLQWFTDMEESYPQESLSKYKGPLLVIYGDADESVPPAISASAVAAANSSSEVVSLVIPTARHGLGFYTNRADIADQVVEATAGFLSERL